MTLTLPALLLGGAALALGVAALLFGHGSPGRTSLEADDHEAAEADQGTAASGPAGAVRPGSHSGPERERLEDDRTRTIPIIFLTARAEFRDRARGLDIGGVDYVTKPFNPLELAPLVRDLLDRIERGQRDELRREKLAELRRLMEDE